MKQAITADKQKAISLVNSAEITFERLKTLEKEKYPSNSLVDYYSILHNFMEAIAYTKGIKFRGEGAHKELIDYICFNFRITESERVFLQDIREYRNRISYEGFSINKYFIEQNSDIIESIILKLKNIHNKI